MGLGSQIKAIEPLGDRVRRLRDEKKWSQAQLAERAGLPSSTVGDIENRHRTRSGHAPALARALGVTLHYLATGEGDPYGAEPSLVAPQQTLESVLPHEQTEFLSSLSTVERVYVEVKLREALADALAVLEKDRKARRRAG